MPMTSHFAPRNSWNQADSHGSPLTATPEAPRQP